ncbi:pitrilysin family protein [Acidipila sp. EB88]|uniref:M16 family metallopeptidase n=1 Tax=Acidipila sp. EB88 TaxID=2305226 RepID=UPI000F5DC99D|nr:pitrilysin family protein [Acidipila sp. EB88]RRA49906.1 insulinase family protein [Acidipila sp. EB88]
MAPFQSGVLPHRSSRSHARLSSRTRRILLAAFPILFVALSAPAQSTPAAVAATLKDPDAARALADFQSRTVVKVLPNGLTLVLCERTDAPVFSYTTIVDAGDANDPGQQSGLAHMFEHLAFKGTEDIGTRDYPAEKVALARLEVAYAAYDAEQVKRVDRDPAKLQQLKAAYEAAEKDANQYVIPNEFTEIAEANGASGLNAQTSLDDTRYFWSMPENRLELWAYLESDRIAHPVPRQFYRERSVVEEERRMRVDSSPVGRLIENFLEAAYSAHPYHRPNVGYQSELDHITATEAAAFHARYYAPSNITVAVVGDFKNTDALPMLERYFGAIPDGGPKPQGVITVEPPQAGERAVHLQMASQPMYLEGYHRPDYRSPDDSVYDALQDIFSNGRTSRLYRSLVRDQRISAEAEGFTGFPGDKYAGLFGFFAVPAPGHTNAELRTAIHKEIDRLKTTDVTDAELAMFKTRARASLLRGLDENQGLAEQLATYQLRYGDWKQLFLELDRVNQVSKADIRRVANTVFTTANRTYAQIDAPDAPSATAAPNTGNEPGPSGPPSAAPATGGAR